jgi:hypothetical protein
MKEDIVSLYEKIEAMKDADPRSKGTVDDLISLYVDIEKVIKAAGWGTWEYEAAICSVYN